MLSRRPRVDGDLIVAMSSKHRLPAYKQSTQISRHSSYLSIGSHFVGVHGPYELHPERKAKFAFRSDAIDMAHEHVPTKMRFNTYIFTFLQ